MHPTVHRDVIKAFLDNRLTAKDFETLYLVIYLRREGFMVEPLYEILNKVFQAVENYWEGCTPEEEDELTNQCC